ncbi:MAG TPA: alkaline phosphatase family protein [Thermoanaerobaculia bacterium]|nr:alkaline phosphatase family protein [Thermoanaerobaculia bacterium]
MGFTLLAGAFPGFLLGSLLAQILFFLNPLLPFQPLPVLRAVVVYGATGALASLVVLAVLRPRARFGFLAWGTFFALATAATLAWVSPSHFAFFLPPGINVRLIKAAVGLTVFAVVAFYTALLHSVLGRRYGWGSVALLALAVLGASGLLLERRKAFPAAAESLAGGQVRQEGSRVRLVVIGIDSASLDAVLPLAEEGLIPFFSQILDGGSLAHLTSLRPNRFSPLWTSVATGRFPYQHGVVGFESLPAPWLGEGLELRLLPAPEPVGAWLRLGAAGRALDARDRERLTLWEITSALGIPTGVVSWPLSAPYPGSLSLGVSERFLAGEPGAEGEVTPPEAASWVQQVRRAVLDLPQPIVAGRSGGREVRAALEGDLWRLALLNGFLDRQDQSGAGFVLLPGLLTASRQFFGGFSAVHFEGRKEPANLEAASNLAAYYVQLDALLADLWARQEQPCLLAVVSAYGVEGAYGWRRLRAGLFDERSLDGYSDRSPDGLLMLYGAGIRAGARIPEAQLVDVVPTLLYALGLPLARDLDGHVLRDAFAPAELSRRPQTFVASYEGLKPPP